MPSVLSAYLVTATLLTVAPGPDTVMVLRAATGHGARHGAATAVGIAIGCLCWGVLAAYGLSALMADAPWAFVGLRWMGAIYLAWLGLKLLHSPRRSFDETTGRSGKALLAAGMSGLLTNLLNPKVGLFYLTLLPQFLPSVGHAGSAEALGLALMHVGIALVWFCGLSTTTGWLGPLLRKPGVLAVVDRSTGLILIMVGAGLAFAVSEA